MNLRVAIFVFFFWVNVVSAQTSPPVSTLPDVDETVEEKTPLFELKDTLLVETPVYFEEDFQKKYTADEYVYEEIPLKGEEVKKEEEVPEEYPEVYEPFDFSWDWFDSLSADAVANFIQWVSILFLVAISLYFGYKYWNNPSLRIKKATQRDLKEIEKLSEKELIETSRLDEIDRLIKEAENQYNYRLALRLQFLKIFKKMMENQFIQYKKDKTNYDYYNEIETPDLKKYFKKISRWYDYVWYGEYYIDQPVYRKALLEFKPSSTLKL